jgi:signal transduction histidine kinase
MLDFTELVATAIANAEARRELEQVAVEQAAVSRLAKLVAEAVPSTEIFAAVVSEIAGLLELPRVALFRFGPDRTASVLASSEDDLAPALFEGWSLPADDPGMLASLLGTGRPVRIDGYAEVGGAAGELARELGLGSAVGVPVIVDGRIWGAVTVGLAPGQPPLPGDTVERLTAFTDLVATAISNAVAQTEIDRLAHEQAALRRVAMLVARGTPPEEVFAAVAEEVGRLLGVALAGIGRYDSPDTVTVVATWAAEDEHGGAHPLVPGPWPLEGGDLASTIARTGRSVRIDDYHGVPGRIAAFVRDELGVVSSVATPVVVEGRLWGTLFLHSKQTHGPLPRDTESRLTGFTELVATAIANTESRAELASSRARIVTTSDDTRRRIERDLHDGVQQRLVTLGLVLRTAQAELPRGLEKVSTELSQVGEGLKAALDELREIARGIHPAILSEKGLAPALKSLARRSPTPVALDVRVEGRLPDGVEVAAYYIVSEMLTNTAKHAQASAVYVDVARADDVLHISVRDDGVGGADPARGSGLVGLRDRVEALGGTIAFQSAKGAGTAVEVMLPLDRTGEASEQVQDASLPQVTGDPH